MLAVSSSFLASRNDCNSVDTRNQVAIMATTGRFFCEQVLTLLRADNLRLFEYGIISAV